LMLRGCAETTGRRFRGYSLSLLELFLSIL
jgi:hypothetical protein